MTADLIPIDRTTAIALFSDRASIDSGLADLRARALAERGDPDISTPAGREKIASVAYSVARSKVAMVKMGKDLTEDWRKRTKLVNEECNRIEVEGDKIKAEIREPLTAWEDAEKARVAGHEAAIAAIENTAKAVGRTGAEISARISLLDELMAEKRYWQEFTYRADHAEAFARMSLEKMLADAQAEEAEATKLEQERIEAARLAAEEAARIQAEREAEIARQAAEKARITAEQAAATEARRVAEVERRERARIEQEAALKLAAEKRERDRVERDRVEAVNRAVEAERQRAEEARRAALREKEAAQKAESDRVKAALKADEDRAKAVLAERQRQQEAAQTAARAVADAETARISDKKRRALINNEIKADLTAAGFDAETAHAVVIALAKGIVRHVKVQY